MIALYAAACAVSFAAGALAGLLIGAVLAYSPGYQRGRAAALHDRTSRATVRRRMLALVIAPKPLPAARRDHKRHTTIRLVKP